MADALDSLPTVVLNAYLNSQAEPTEPEGPVAPGLALPSPMELQEFREGVSDAEAIQRAADLFVMATGLKAATTPLEERIVRVAILEMAWAIGTRHDDMEKEFSPFSSERIGSYSYSKALKSVSSGQSTGISSFDAAVAYFLALAMAGSGTDTEWVFKKGYDENAPLIASHDPSYSFAAEAVPWPAGPPVYTSVESVDHVDGGML